MSVTRSDSAVRPCRTGPHDSTAVSRVGDHRCDRSAHPPSASASRSGDHRASPASPCSASACRRLAGGSRGAARLDDNARAAPPPTPPAASAQQTERSPLPAACAPTGCRTTPTPPASGLVKESLQQLGVSSSRFQSAQSACNHLLPNGGQRPNPAQVQQVRAQRSELLRSACAATASRTSPTPAATVAYPTPPPLGINQGSPKFEAANQACRKYRPPVHALECRLQRLREDTRVMTVAADRSRPLPGRGRSSRRPRPSPRRSRAGRHARPQLFWLPSPRSARASSPTAPGQGRQGAHGARNADGLDRVDAATCTDASSRRLDSRVGRGVLSFRYSELNGSVSVDRPRVHRHRRPDSPRHPRTTRQRQRIGH